MDQHKVPGGPVYSPQQTLDDEHVNAIGFFEDVQYPSAAQASPLSGFPVSLSKTPGVVHSPAPTLSQHTDEILHELGYSGTDIEALRGARIV